MNDRDKDYLAELSDIAFCLDFYKTWYKPYESSTQAIVAVLTDGVEIYLTYDSWNHGKGARIDVSGHYPKYGRTGGSQQTYTPGLGAPAISCSAKKNPEKIAREIENRFLPYYRPLYLEMKAKAEQNTRDIDNAFKIIKELTGEEPRDQQRAANGTLRIAPPADIYAHISSYDGERITWERFTTSADQARKIIALLKSPTIDLNQIILPGEKSYQTKRAQERLQASEAKAYQESQTLRVNLIREAALNRTAHQVELCQDVFNNFTWLWIDNQLHTKAEKRFSNEREAAHDYATQYADSFDFDRIKNKERE